MKTKIKIFLIAGEPSGDVLGAKLMSEIKKQSRYKVDFIGIGGDKMTKQGLNSIFPISDLSLMGFIEVLPHIPKLLKRIKQTTQAIINSGADIVITIDSPDFCFRVIKKLNKNSLAKNVKKVHFIAPTVWAYRQKRAKKIAKLYDLLLVILPFEPPYFEKYGLETLFIGHPIIENKKVIDLDKKEDFCKNYQIKNTDLVITTMVGSRFGEVKRILPEVILAINILAKNNSNLLVLMPAVKKVKNLIKENLPALNAKTIVLDESEKYQAFAISKLAIAKSGTNNLEIALAGLPMITIYKINPLTHFIIKRMIKIKFANLINIILGYGLIKELLQDNCNGHKIAFEAQNLIDNPEIAKLQINESYSALKILGLNFKESPSSIATKKILSYF